MFTARVRVQTGLGNEALLAHSAQIRPLARVQPGVRRQIVLHLERLGAVRALKRPLSRVRADVVHHAVLLFEAALAVRAHIVAHVRVNFQMLLQVRLAREVLITLRALEHRRPSRSTTRSTGSDLENGLPRRLCTSLSNRADRRRRRN